LSDFERGKELTWKKKKNVFQGVHYEAVGVFGNLVHSSQGIKRRVLEEGALQPVIGLLSSRCGESQREAALLLGQFATTEPDFKAKIVQRGAVPPLVEMLSAGDAQLQEMAAFALGRLAQNADNQAGVVQAGERSFFCFFSFWFERAGASERKRHQEDEGKEEGEEEEEEENAHSKKQTNSEKNVSGGLKPLLALLASRNGNLQHNAAFALYGLADSDDNVAPLVREGAVQALLDCELLVQPSKDCVQKTLKRLEDKARAPAVLATVLFAMRGGDRAARERVAAALARLVTRDEDLRSVFVDRRGLDVLLGLLTDPSRCPRAQREASGALFELARKANATAPIDCAPAPPTPQVYLGVSFFFFFPGVERGHKENKRRRKRNLNLDLDLAFSKKKKRLPSSPNRSSMSTTPPSPTSPSSSKGGPSTRTASLSSLPPTPSARCSTATTARRTRRRSRSRTSAGRSSRR